jgi:hypothetical protein
MLKSAFADGRGDADDAGNADDADDAEEMGMPYRVRAFLLEMFELLSGGDWDQGVEMFLASKSISLGS